MFGNTKPFGTASTFGGSSFGNTSTPFGQSTTAFGAKPASSNVFGTSTFGVSTPNAMSGGLFGTATPASGTGLFGQPSTAFGAPASTSTGGFGFGATSTSGGLFGSSTPSTQSSGGLFGNTGTSAFGTPRPTFGGFSNTTPGTGLFGQSTNTGTGMFGSAGGFAATAPTGTTIKFNPPTGTDTMMKGGVSTSIGTRHQCITCMKEYENKSLEELRVEDYAANRKGSTSAGLGFGAPAQQPGLFGAPAAASTSAFAFGGTTQAKPLFGTTGATNTFGSGGLFGQPAQNQNTGLFGKSVGFGAPATSAAPAFNFGASTGTSLFGQSNQQKPLFGQTAGSTGLFGNTATTQSTGFGTSTGFGGFGATNQQSTGLFGAKPTGFGTTNTTTTNTFSFGNTNNMSGGGLFGQKPSLPAFGAGTAFGTPSSGFGSFGTTPAAGTSLFGQTKPATSAFGTTGNMFGGGLGTSFGTPSFSMGLGTNTGTGLFGATNANKAPGFSFGNTGSTGFNFGATNPSSSSFNFGPSPAMQNNDPNNSAAFQQAQQQILAMTANPFGDSPLFRNPIKDVSREAEVLKPTNPSAQKALLNDNHYKVDLLPTAKIKPKPWSPAPTGKMLLFDGLEDEEPSLGTAAFLPKRSIKKLVLKNINSSQSSLTLTSSISPSQATRIDVSISLKNSGNSPNNSYTEKKSSEAPFTIDITDSNANNKEKQIQHARQTSDSRTQEPLREASPPSNFRVSLNNSMDDSIAALHTNKPPVPSNTYSVWNKSEENIRNNDSSVENTSILNKDFSDGPGLNRSHPTGITLTRPSYYTIPHLDEMIHLMDENQLCLVQDFTIGREGYGKVTFPGVTNVAGLNLDEIVTFGKKEIIIYPDDENKPPVGKGLNRKAVVTLENVWPIDKTNHCLIKDPERISTMRYRDKIVRCTTQLGAKFVDYKPESGSWTFEVEHFSKYGLEDSDEEMDVAKPPEKNSAAIPSKTQVEQHINGKLNSGDTLLNQELKRKPLVSYHTQDQEMETLSSQLISYPLEFTEDEDLIGEVTNQTRPILSNEIDAERIQGMKVSFFQDMDDENWGSSMYNANLNVFNPLKKIVTTEENVYQPKKQNKSSSDISKTQRYLDRRDDQSYLSSPTPGKCSDLGVQNSLSSLSIASTKLPDWFSDLPVFKSNLDKRAQASKSMQTVLNKIFLKPFKDSVLYEKQHLLSDAGYFMGRTFRVGWSADGTFANLRGLQEDVREVHPKFLSDAPQSIGRSPHSKSGFTISLENLTTFPLSIADNKRIEKTTVDALELQLKHSASTLEDGIPLFLPEPGVENLHNLASLFENVLRDADPLASETDFIRQCSYVWDLLVSLWGKVPGLDNPGRPSNYATQIARREALSQWLIKTTDHDIVKNIDSQKDDYLYKIFLNLNGRHHADAVKLAQQHRDFRLSLLLSQAEVNSIVRKLIGKQLLIWKQNGVYEFIKHNRKILYVLLSGMLVYEDVNCCENLKWKQVLSLLLWYHCNPNASVQDVIKKYDESFQGTGPFGKYATPPYPPYTNGSEYAENTEDASDMIFDTCYHVLKLYCDRSHRFDLLLMPETYSPDHLDYRLSWLLLQALSTLGYNIPIEMVNTLHLNFASQLESLNLWHWAIFVLLHHSEKYWRMKHVKDVLLRCVALEQNIEILSREKFLIEQLHIPEKWIFEAKAIKASTLNKRAEEAWYLLKAGCWGKSHSVVIKYLSSDAVINEDFDYLLKYLKELSPPERSSTILDWANGGQVYLDYINMCRIVKDILSREASAYDLEKFRPEVISLCERLSSIPATSLKDRLSIAEMAKKTATILRSISILSASRNNSYTLLTMLASSIKHLPMPHDYAASENRYVAHSFLDEISTEAINIS